MHGAPKVGGFFRPMYRVTETRTRRGGEGKKEKKSEVVDLDRARL